MNTLPVTLSVGAALTYTPKAMTRQRSRKAMASLGYADTPSTPNVGEPRLLNPRELADVLRVSPMTIRRMLKAQELPFYRVGKRVRFKLHDVLEALPKRVIK